jgi:hypothetical protein
VPLPAARQAPNLEENQGFWAFQLSPQEAPSVWSEASEPSSGRWNYGREMVEKFLPKMATSTSLLGSFTCRKARHGTDGFTSSPKDGVLKIFSARKVRRLRPGLNPRTWVPKASTLPLDHRSRLRGWTYLLNFLYVYETWLRGLLCQHAEYIMNVTSIIKESSWTQVTSGTRHSLPVFFFLDVSEDSAQDWVWLLLSLYSNGIPHSQTRLMEEKYPTYWINKTVNAVRKTVQLPLICAQCFTLLSKKRKVLVVILRIRKSALHINIRLMKRTHPFEVFTNARMRDKEWIRH